MIFFGTFVSLNVIFGLCFLGKVLVSKEICIFWVQGWVVFTVISMVLYNPCFQEF